MSKTIAKSTAITDAKISFVSLVNKAANKRKFLITKAEDGVASIESYGSILMADSKTHFVTGVVYEPMSADAHDDFMTAEEIVKAERYFRENSNQIDIQHSFEKSDACEVVDSWITKCDCTIGGEDVKKGTWMMTVKIEDDTLWDKVLKKEITGYSMGGVGKYSDEDINLADESSLDVVEKTSAKKNLIVKLAEVFGYDCIKKGAVKENFEEASRSNNFWAAFNSLETTLRRWDNMSSQYIYESDSDKITEALSEFEDILRNILTTGEIQKAVIANQPKSKSSDKNDDECANEKNKKNVKPKVDTSVKKEEKDLTVTEFKELVKSTVAEEVKIALGESQQDENQVNKSEKTLADVSVDELTNVIKSSVQTEIKKYAAIRGKATNIDIEDEEVEKSEEPQHYLYGIL